MISPRQIVQPSRRGLDHSDHVLLKFSGFDIRSEQLIDLPVIGFCVKFDHLLPRHQHSRISKPCCDAAIMPPSAKGVHGLPASSPRSKFYRRIFFLGRQLALWSFFARHEVKPAALYADERALALGRLSRSLGKLYDFGRSNPWRAMHAVSLGRGIRFLCDRG
jgi:hypothetical protein